MTRDQSAHIQPSKHSTEQVDEFLDMVEDNVDHTEGAGSPAIMPRTDLGVDGRPLSDTPKNPKM